MRNSKLLAFLALVMGAVVTVALLWVCSSIANAAPAAQSGCSDAFEPDGLPKDAKALVSEQIQHHVLCDGDADWYSFVVVAGGAYQVEVSPANSNVSPVIYLFAVDASQVLASNARAGESPDQFTLSFRLAQAGTYFLQVKNFKDVGGPDSQYSITLHDLTRAPSTPAPTSAANVPTSQPGAPTATPTIAFETLLRPDGKQGALSRYDAGTKDALEPDLLEPNNTFTDAAAINVDSIYTLLNMVPLPGTNLGADTDFYKFQAKPGVCYAVATGEQSSGLDTTLGMWIEAPNLPNGDKRRLLVVNDDKQMEGADLDAKVRWCNDRDAIFYVEVHNYGDRPLTDARGKTYSLAVYIDPSTPTVTATSLPTATLTPKPTTPPTGSGGTGGTGGNGGTGGGNNGGGNPPAPTTTKPPVPTNTSVPSPSTSTSISTPTLSILPVSPTSGPTGTPDPADSVVSVSVVVWIPVPANAPAPVPGDGVRGLDVILVDAFTSKTVGTATTDANGNALLTWRWGDYKGPMRIAIPAIRGSVQTVTERDFSISPLRGSGGTRLLEVKLPTYELPGIFP